MMEALGSYLHAERDSAYRLLRHLLAGSQGLLPHADLNGRLQAWAQEQGDGTLLDSPLGRLLRRAPQAVAEAPWLWIADRPRIGTWRFLRLHAETMDVHEIPVAEYLAAQERVVEGRATTDPWLPEVDLQPFNRDFPRMREVWSIGRGVEFLNRHLSSRILTDLEGGGERLVSFLEAHEIRGRPLLLGGSLHGLPALRAALRQAEELLRDGPQDATWSDVAAPLRELGFEAGWGRTVARIRDTMRLLADILEAPAPTRVEEFLARIPMITSIVILSPHGYFGQAKVLGLPDTGGQVVYILDQARALEREMRQRLEEQGIDLDPRILVVTRLIPEARGTTCGERWEPIEGTDHAAILRVPFHDEQGRVVPQWISRFEVWPYLERFALDAEKEVLRELGGRPALIVGNYSDGNLVASLLSRRLGVTQCNIAHALEKSKYPQSALHWRDHDEQYHFACQFTADLIAMNTADFIITSTFQEIRGTETTVGQYEDYEAFTMPGLFRVVHGVDVFDPKFNVVSPGADPDVYFPWWEADRRLAGLQPELEALVFGDGGGTPARGELADPDKPLLFTMARLDTVKNLTGLVDWYGSSPRLRKAANLLVVGGHLDVAASADHEERQQIERMHALIEKHDLDRQMRWVEFQTERNLVGELYRFVADRRGMFCQPALYEAYGLTVIESMSSGLPVCATCHGGPSEILVHGESGHHIDPYQGAQAAELMADLFERFASDPAAWEGLSRATVARIEEGYTWQRYAQRMLTLAKVYGFWKYVTNLEREETRRYLELLYSLEYRALAASVRSAPDDA